MVHKVSHDDGRQARCRRSDTAGSMRCRSRRWAHHTQHHAAGIRRDRHVHCHLSAVDEHRCHRRGRLRCRIPLRLFVRPSADHHRAGLLLLPERRQDQRKVNRMTYCKKRLPNSYFQTIGRRFFFYEIRFHVENRYSKKRLSATFETGLTEEIVSQCNVIAGKTPFLTSTFLILKVRPASRRDGNWIFAPNV